MLQVVFILLCLTARNAIAAPVLGTRAAFKLPPSVHLQQHVYPNSWFSDPSNRIMAPSLHTFPIVYPMIVRAHTSPFYQRDPLNDLNRLPAHLFEAPETEIIATEDEPSRIKDVGGKRDSYEPFFGLPPLQATQPTRIATPQPQPTQFFNVFSQVRSQDEKGGYHFSYSGGPSARTENRDHNGVVRGSYSYVDPNGDLKIYNYIADKNGYRVSSQTKNPVQLQNLQLVNVPELIIAKSA